MIYSDGQMIGHRFSIMLNIFSNTSFGQDGTNPDNSFAPCALKMKGFCLHQTI